MQSMNLLYFPVLVQIPNSLRGLSKKTGIPSGSGGTMTASDAGLTRRLMVRMTWIEVNATDVHNAKG